MTSHEPSHTSTPTHARQVSRRIRRDDDPAAWWRHVEGAGEIAELEDVRPCAGVAPGPTRRREGDPLPWALLDQQLAGIERRKGRPNVWAGSATQTMVDVKAQTARMSELTRHDLRTPPWLRTTSIKLKPTALLFVSALVCAYEAGWGGLADCQSTIAAELQISERTLRNLLNGRTWHRKDGTVVHTPGLVERGVVTSTQLHKPGGEDGRPTSDDWCLYRVGPAIEAAALWSTLAKSWTKARAPRGSGWTHSLARKAISWLRSRAGRERFAACSEAWAARPGRAHDNDSPPATVDAEPRNSRAAAPTTPVESPDTRARSASTPAKSTAWQPPPRPEGPTVDVGEVLAALDQVRASQRSTAATPAELDAARAECARRRALDVEEARAEATARAGDNSPRGALSVASSGRGPAPVQTTNEPTSPASNWAAHCADNPASPGPFGDQARRLDGRGPAPALSSRRSGLPEENCRRLAPSPIFEPSSADGPSAVRPDDVDARRPGLADGRTDRARARSTRPPATSSAAIERRLTARGDAAAEAARLAAATRERDPQLAAVLLDLADAWADDEGRARRARPPRDELDD